MLEVTGATVEEATEALARAVDLRCAVAFAFGCRLAFTTISEGPLGPRGLVSIRWDFVVLTPGERPPEGWRWTVYENRNGQAVGRSA